jgi:S-adenosylmethionine:tRNA ribosyltransferase-isomerase
MSDDPHHIDAYSYDLPPEQIAQEPLPDRSASRLLVLDRGDGTVRHRAFEDLPGILSPGDLLVLNRSRVLPARLRGRRPGGGEAEILLVRRRAPDLWDALVRPGRRLRPGVVVEVAPGFRARMEDRPSPGAGQRSVREPLRPVRLLVDAGGPEAAIRRHGHVPLPPYIRRDDTPADRERYQTVYAKEDGSVAAPTAGLHFSSSLMERLAARGVHTTEIVLHVGPGTFRPVEVEDVREHRVDCEVFNVPAPAQAAIARARADGRRVIAVGTTTTRALETVATTDGRVEAGDGETALVITPGHRFRAVDALVTNFHLPRSSLLLLVCAFAGREVVLRAYRQAIRKGYRFYSYGDAMLVL